MDIESICGSLRKGAAILALHNAVQKNKALSAVAASIDKNRKSIIEANSRDVEMARAKGMSEALVERLLLDDKRISSIVSSMQVVIDQTDPIGEVVSGWTTPSGLQIKQVRFPLGVVAIIYESRPNVTVDAFCLAYKSGNSILLRGSSSAYESNKALVNAIKEGLHSVKDDGVESAIELCPLCNDKDNSHKDVDEILNAVGLIDVVLPRGGAKLIKNVTSNARIPVIETGSGICHLYVDEDADIKMAAEIAENAKIQRPGACNAIETILVNEKEAEAFLPLLLKQFAGRVTIKADEASYKILINAEGHELVQKASKEDFGYEFLDFVVAIKVVSSIEEAITFINEHNTKHSESIVTNNRAHARIFQQQIDAACVYVNASTRFTDGGEFGFGAELGISTQRLHARGPMGIKALTTTKYLIDGDGQVRL
ncbi:MAG: glutamate-5-semialdehyde dehydrogenase [Treponema sp.]|nr:glutamate-5-semialdehyde dehydrogenase [Treponema sp.]